MKRLYRLFMEYLERREVRELQGALRKAAVNSRRKENSDA